MPNVKQLLVSASLVAIVGCSGSHQTGFSGTVKEAGSGRPISGAVVAVKWTWYTWGTNCLHVQTATTDKNGRYEIPTQEEVFYSTASNVELESIEVYKKGYTDIGWGLQGMLKGLDGRWVVYDGAPDPAITSISLEQLGLRPEPGEFYWHPKTPTTARSRRPEWWSGSRSNLYLVPDVRRGKKRLSHLRHIVSLRGCWGADSRERNLLPFLKPVLNEALTLTTNAEKNKDLKYICGRMGEVATRTDNREITGSESNRARDEYLKSNYPACYKLFTTTGD